MDGSELAHFLDFRCGKLCASKMADALDMRKDGKPGAKRIQLLKDLLAERVTGNSVHRFVSDAMRHGTEWEDTAKAEFETHSGEVIRKCETIEHPRIEMFCSTPDGLIGADAVLEVKCPTSSTYLDWMLAGVVPDCHKPQMLAQIACSQRSYAVFVAFDPFVRDKSKRLFVRPFEPTVAEIEKIEFEARQFLNELDRMFELFTSTEAV